MRLVIRYGVFAVAWLVVCALGALLLMNAPTWLAKAVGAIIVLLGVQAFISELMGLEVTSYRISAPWRLSSLLPLPLWRRRMRVADIENIASLPNLIGFSRVRIRKKSGARSLLLFPGRKNKLQFVKFMTKGHPGVDVFKSVR